MSKYLKILKKSRLSCSFYTKISTTALFVVEVEEQSKSIASEEVDLGAVMARNSQGTVCYLMEYV